jgi:hypothetical protein
MAKRISTRDNLRVGRAQVRTTAPSHTSGVHEGNQPGNYRSQVGHLADGRSTAQRSTGINADKRNPIDPRMPNLSPA